MSADFVHLSIQRDSRVKVQKEQITPYKIALLILIDEHCKISSQAQKCGAPVMYSDAEELAFLAALLQLVQSPDVDLKTFKKLIQGFVKPSAVEAILDKLNCIYSKSIDALMTLMQALPSSVFQPSESGGPAFMSKNSVCGLFIRRLCLAFDKLSFSQVTHLYRKFRVMYAELLSDENASINAEFCGSRSVIESHNFLDTVEDDMSLNDDDIIGCRTDGTPNRTSCNEASHYSQRQAEYFIAQQTFLLSHNEREALSPKEMQEKISSLLLFNPDMAEAHYLSYLNCLRIREYCGALDSLHHYFDSNPTLPGQPNPAAAAAGGNKARLQDDDQTSRCYRYAVLGLAAMQYRFGHRREALIAVQESIRVAQEANDSVCLQHALGWLQRLGIQIEGGQSFLLDKLIQSAGELNLGYLTSLSVQALVRHSALSAYTPSLVFEYLAKSEMFNCQHLLTDLVSTGLCQKSALWTMYGRSDMSLLAAQLVLSLNSMESGAFRNMESECAAMCHVAKLHADQGLYDLAFEIIRSARERFPESSADSHLWISREQKIRFCIALHHSCYASADQAISSLAIVDRLQASYCRCLLLAAQCEHSKLVTAVDSLIEECRHNETSQQHFNELIIKLLLLKGVAFCSTNSPSLAIKPLLDAMCIANQHHYLLLSALCKVHIAFVQFQLGCPKMSSVQLTQAYAVVMSHGSLYDRARLVFLDVKCRIALAAKQPGDKRLSMLKTCVKKLDLVIAWYKQLESYQQLKSAYYLQGRMYHELAMTSDRNRCAMEFRNLDMQYPTFGVAAVRQM